MRGSDSSVRAVVAWPGAEVAASASDSCGEGASFFGATEASAGPAAEGFEFVGALFEDEAWLGGAAEATAAAACSGSASADGEPSVDAAPLLGEVVVFFL